MLLTILLFSCENNSSCIDADDYGNTEKEIINVPASLSEVCYNTIKPTSYLNNYTDISPIATSAPPGNGVNPTALINCLTKEDLRTYVTRTDGKALINSMDSYPPNNKGCLNLDKLSEERIICENVCELECISRNQNLAGNTDLMSMIWKSNTPRATDSSSGINVTPNSKIFVNAEGEINFDKTVGSKNTPSEASLTLDEFNGNKVVKLEFSGNYTDFQTLDYYRKINEKRVISNIDVARMQGLARRSLFFLKSNIGETQFDKANIDKVKILDDRVVITPSSSGNFIKDSSADGLINFKIIRNTNCGDAKIDVSIKKNESEVVYYKVTNLKLSEVYTTKNIPTYSNSKIEITVNNITNNALPQACIIEMQTQKYFDIKIENSGIVQLKMKDLLGNAMLNDSCKLYGRIINHGVDAMTPPADVSIIGILNDAALDGAFIASSASGFSNTSPLQGNPFKVKNVYIGLNAYSSKDKKDLAESSCRLQLKDLPNCKIESSSCSISSSDINQSPQGCSDDFGSDGTIVVNQSGNGGGGGGNVGGSAGSYNGVNKAGGSGKNGQSYVNPEFKFGEISSENLEVHGKGVFSEAIQDNNIVKGGDGYVVLWWEANNKTPFIATSSEIIFNPPPSNNKKLHYEIYGGGGGAGGKCGSARKGGKGGNGDYFSGTLDFSNFSTTIALKIKVGSGGYSGKNCGSTSLPQNASQNPDSSTRLKGGNGGINNSTEASGGAGGSASYISLIRSDETDDTSREDFLVIAGGGGGGGGAGGDNDIDGFNSDDANAYIRNNRLESKKNGLRLAITLEALPTIGAGFTSDYYEYDDFFTKTIQDSIDPLSNIEVKHATYSDPFFVRKGQLLRILPKSFEGEKCGDGISIKITPRLAVLCLDGVEENNFINPNCIADRGALEATLCKESTVVNPNCPSVTPTSGSANDDMTSTKGCIADLACTDSTNANFCPDLNCTKIICTNDGTDTTSKSGCTRGTIPSGCVAGCATCATQKIALMQSQAPKIDITASICYHFENTKISVHNLLAEYNKPGATSAIKKNLMKDIQKIEDYNDAKNFGNFNTYEISPGSESFFETKNQISFGNVKLDALLIKNDNFTNLGKIAFKNPADGNYIINSRDSIAPTGFTTTVKVKNTRIQQKGRGLQIALCKEDDENSHVCSTNNPPKILAYFIQDPALENNAFRFNSFGVLERARALNAGDSRQVGITISDCLGSSPDENFICFTTNESVEEVKKYRLIFKVKDADNNYSNNTGEYNIKVEKKDSLASLSGGFINQILQPIVSNLDGVKDNPTTSVNEEKPGIIRKFYVSLINNAFYRLLISLTIILALSFYGMGYLMGVNELKHSEVVKILFKIGFIYMFTSTETGWSWFNKFFVELFKNATDYISFSVAENFDQANSRELRLRIIDNNFYDRGILFSSVDAVINLILAGAVQKKMMALLFSSIFGWLYFLILYYSLFTYVYAVANSMLLYITCQIITSILFVLGPIFFIFLMFKVTKDMFDNWLKALIGFSLQQIFLVMTLALFNSFVVGFLKLALGYRVCWTNILTLNTYISKVTLLNFWTIAGTNTPHNSIEDSPDESFGNSQNMPSIYLFLYLMIIVSLMSKFIELFTNLAVTISGGLKASTIAADSANMGKSIFKAASSGAGMLYNKTAGRAVSNIDNTLFDSGSIANERRKAEKQQFISDVKTRVSLNIVGNKAISEYKKDKDNALKLSGMSVDKQKETLSEVKQAAIKEYAKSNGINERQLDRIANATGVNYSGNNLFGMAAQAGKQAFTSGGSLINSMNDKKIDASFSKKEANSVLKKMDSADQDKFIKSVKEGTVHVNKGKIENAQAVAKAIVNPMRTANSARKATVSAVSSAISSTARSVGTAIGASTKENKLRKEAIKNLENEGKITKKQEYAPLRMPDDAFVKKYITKPLVPKTMRRAFLKGLNTASGSISNTSKEWARTTDEKNAIKNEVRKKLRNDEFNLPKLTDKSTIKDLEATIKYTENTKKNTGTEKFNDDNTSLSAKVSRAKDRMGNLFGINGAKESLEEKSSRFTKKNEENFKNIRSERETNDLNNKKTLLELKEEKNGFISKDKEMKNSKEYEKFSILEEAKNSIKEKQDSNLYGKKADIDDAIKDKMEKIGMGNNLREIEALSSETKSIKYLDKLMEKEASKNPELFNKIIENKNNIEKVNSSLSDLYKKEINTKEDVDKKEKKTNEFESNFEKASKINQKNIENPSSEEAQKAIKKFIAIKNPKDFEKFYNANSRGNSDFAGGSGAEADAPRQQNSGPIASPLTSTSLGNNV